MGNADHIVTILRKSGNSVTFRTPYKGTATRVYNEILRQFRRAQNIEVKHYSGWIFVSIEEFAGVVLDR